MFFIHDKKAIDESSYLLVVYNGHNGTTGTAWEIGYAYGKDISIIVYIPKGATDISLMVGNSISGYINDEGKIIIFRSLDEKMAYLGNYNQK